jgi:hypothetical protein
MSSAGVRNKDWILSWPVRGTLMLFFIHAIGYLVYSLGGYIAMFCPIVPVVDCPYNRPAHCVKLLSPDPLPRGAREKNMRLLNP